MRKNKNVSKFLSFICLFIFSLSLLSVSNLPFDFAQFEKFVHKVMDQWKVPGVAIGVIKGKKLIYARGFGYRDLKRKLPVTHDTLFAIGSCTKAFTATAAGILVDEGKLEWDKPIIEYLPNFRLYNDYATTHTTLRDLLTHRTGLPRHDLVWYGASLTREQLYERLRYLKPSKDFRQLWQYQNLMFMTAGYLIEKITGKSWEDFVHKRILQPLKMSRTNFSVEVSKKDSNAALPYREEKGRLKRIVFRNIDAMGPAGSINSTIKDMANWIILQLNKGLFRGKRIISKTTLKEIHTPQMIIPRERKYKELFYSSYAMGWAVTAYRGHLILLHGGSIDGFVAMVSFMPDDNLGVIVFVNKSRSPVTSIFTYALYDRLLGYKPAPWNERFWKEYEEAKKAKKKAQICKTGTYPSHPLRDYEGEYEHPAYGVVKLKVKNGKLVLTFHDYELPLKHCHYDIFIAEKEVLTGRIKVSFFTNKAGRIDRIAIPLEPKVEDIIFRRKTAEIKNIAFLKKFTGRYSAGETIIEIDLRGKKLVIKIGELVQKLLPLSEKEFQLKDYPSMSVKFIENAEGKVTAVQIIQPDGAYSFKKIK